MYCKSNMNCTNMLLLYMLFNIFIMIGDRGGNMDKQDSKEESMVSFSCCYVFNCNTSENNRITDNCF